MKLAPYQISLLQQNQETHHRKPSLREEGTVGVGRSADHPDSELHRWFLNSPHPRCLYQEASRPGPHRPKQQRGCWRNSWAACLARQPALWEDGSIKLAELPMASPAQSAGPGEALVLIRACSNSTHHSLSSPSGSLCPCHVE